jgi:hypothetical protein
MGFKRREILAMKSSWLGGEKKKKSPKKNSSSLTQFSGLARLR